MNGMRRVKLIFLKHIYLIKGIASLSIFKNVRIGKASKVYRFSYLRNVHIGNFSYVAPFGRVVNCEIGNFTSIGSHVSIGGAHHDYSQFSTSPLFFSVKNATGYSSNTVIERNSEIRKTFIGHDVWIGTKVIIKAGIKIGNGSVIGAGSIVTKDVLPYTVVAGNPAKIIKNRFHSKDDLIEASSYYHLDLRGLQKFLRDKTSL